MGFQAQVLRQHCETVRVQVHSPSFLQWVGKIQPAPYCECYEVEIQYRTNTKFQPRPRVFVRNPLLQKRDGRGCPHRYGDKEPCLYYPPANEWNPSMLLAYSIVPWTSRWLYFYEIWLATGEWHGGGIEH